MIIFANNTNMIFCVIKKIHNVYGLSIDFVRKRITKEDLGINSKTNLHRDIILYYLSCIFKRLN